MVELAATGVWREGCALYVNTVYFVCCRAVSRLELILGRIAIFMCGFHRIRVRGVRATAAQAGVLTVAPHSTYFDGIMWFVASHLPTGVSRTENISIPVLGSMYCFF